MWPPEPAPVVGTEALPAPGADPPKAQAAPAPTATENLRVCARLVQHDSLRWECACGASGPVARSGDGIPYVDAEVLRHAPGERR